jgi:hypothetical protein
MRWVKEVLGWLMVAVVAAEIVVAAAILTASTAHAATAFLYKTHAPGLGKVLCYYRDQKQQRHVISLPNGSTCPATIEV